MASEAPGGLKPTQQAVRWGKLFRPEVTAAAIREALAARDPRAYEQLEASPMVAGPEVSARCERLLKDGWSSGGTLYPLAAPMPWTELPRGPAFDAHSWKPLTHLLGGHSLMGERRFFDAAYAVIADWVETFHAATDAVETPRQMDDFIGQPGDPVWYDMSAGVRAYRLAYALEVRARDDDASDAELERLAASLWFHMEALSRPRFFQAHNNHGLYQALGQLAAAQRFIDLPKMREYAALASIRLEQVLREHFFESGVHKEHSPGYHYMLLGTLVGARNSGVLQNFHFQQMVGRMEEALAWMILPDATTAPMGDTDVVSVKRKGPFAEAFANPELRWLLSAGEAGVEPTPGARGYPDAGYAFARLKSPHGGWSYLAQGAGFHSRTHKQADHLAFLWWDRGRNVLIDPGRYAFGGRTAKGSELFEQGFWYADPKRVLVERTRAHNTVEIDGRDFPRVGVEPFGSALVQASEQGGLAVFEAALTHFGSIAHRRVLVMNPGEFLIVVDWLDDATGASHAFAQRFLLAPEWEAAAGPRGQLAASADGGPGLVAVDLTGEAALGEIVKGRTEPELAGWAADKANSLVPAATFAFGRSGKKVVFATLFAFADDVKVPPGVQVIGDKPPVKLNWIADGRRRSVTLRRGEGGLIAAALEA